MLFLERREHMGLLELAVVVLLVAWLAGFAFNVGGGLIHVLLIVAVVMFFGRYLRTRTI